MKMKKFFEAIDEEDEDIQDSPQEEIEELEEEEIEEEIEEEDTEPSQDDVVESLLSTLRQIIKNSNIDRAFIFTDEEGVINIQFVLNKTEKFPNIMKIMNILKKLESDILIQYESEFDLWETREGDPLLTAKFFYDEYVSNPTFDDEDDDKYTYLDEPPF